jgi:hypothetical protein
MSDGETKPAYKKLGDGLQQAKEAFFHAQKFLLPHTKDEQRCIVAYLDSLQAKIKS